MLDRRYRCIAAFLLMASSIGGSFSAYSDAARSSIPQTQDDRSSSTVSQESSQNLRKTLCVRTTYKTLPCLEIRSSPHIGLAIYQRSGFYWIVLDAPQPVDIAPASNDQPSPIRDLQIIPSDSAVTLLRLTLQPSSILEPMLIPEGWRFIVKRYHQEERSISRKAPQYAWSHNLQHTAVHLTAPYTAVHSFKDPVVGDPCLALLTHDLLAYQDRPLSCVAFDTLETLQGYVVTFKDVKDTVIQKSPDTVCIQYKNGRSLSQDQNMISKPSTDLSPRVIDFPKELIKGSAWSQEMTKKQHDLINTSGQSHHQARLNLALFYLTTFHYVESLSELSTLETETPMIALDPKFRALRGSVLYFMNRYEESLKDFSLPALTDIPEIQAWKTLCERQLNLKQSSDMPWADVDKNLKQYPRYALEKIAFTGAQHAHHRAQYIMIKPFLDLLDGAYDPSSKTLYHDLMGYYAFATQDHEQAYQFWGAVAENTPVPYQGLASMADVMRQWSHYQSQPQEGIQILESARPFLYDEPLIRPLLEALARLYTQAASYPESVSVWSELIEKYGPQTYTQPLCQALDLMLQDDACFQKNPLNVVGLFEKNLPHISLQDPQGRALMMKGVKRLEALSLWERATTLLTDLMRQTPEPQARIPYVTALAELCLKRGLLTQALNYTQQGLKLTPYLTTQDRASLLLIQAHILHTQGRDQDAEALLKNQSDPTLQNALAGLYLEQKRWDHAFELYQSLLVEHPPQPQDEVWQHQVLNLAVAAFYLKDPQKCQWVHQTFQETVQGSAIEKAFRLLSDDHYQGPLDSQLLTVP